VRDRKVLPDLGIGNTAPGGSSTKGETHLPQLMDLLKRSGRNMLPKNAIQLRNSSDATLVFYVREVSGTAGWQPVKMEPREEPSFAFLPFGSP
jgi:hypothetical protein